VGHALFVTFRLHGSLPASRVFPPANLNAGKAFVTMDRILDGGGTGPHHLRMPQIAQLVEASLTFAVENDFVEHFGYFLI